MGGTAQTQTQRETNMRHGALEYDKMQHHLNKRWMQELTKLGGYWKHDGNPKRPFIRLTSGKLSNCYVNCTALSMRSHLLQEAAAQLVALQGKAGLMYKTDAVVGPAMGAITLAYELARASNAVAMYTVKQPDGTMALDPRFPIDPHIVQVDIAEDVVTTFGSTQRSIDALHAVTGERGLQIDCVYAIVNRLGTRERGNCKIVALVEINDAKTWDEGNNPFTPDGKELVPPLKAKGNWAALNAQY